MRTGRRTGPVRTALAAVATAVALAVAAPTAVPAAAATDPDGPLRVATELPAPGFWNGAGAADGGFEADLAQALAARLGRPGVVVVPVPFAQIVRGRFAADLALAQVTITPARARVVDFGVPYLTVDQGVLVRRDGPDPRAPGARWGVARATTGATAVRTVVGAERVRTYANAAKAFAALRNGAVDAVLIDVPIARAVAADSGGGLKVAGGVPTGERYGAVLRRGAPGNTAVADALAALVADGTVARLEAAAFGGDPGPVPRFLP